MPVNPVTGSCVVDAEARQRSRSDGENEPLFVEVEKVYQCRIRGEIACESATHGEDVLHPFDEKSVPARSLECKTAIEDPRRGRRAKKRDDASAVAIPMQYPHEQLQYAGVDDETDHAAEAKCQKLLDAGFFHANIDFIFSAVGCSITPRSVTMASMRSAGVTSNTGFHADAPSTT